MKGPIPESQSPFANDTNLLDRIFGGADLSNASPSFEALPVDESTPTQGLDFERNFEQQWNLQPESPCLPDPVEPVAPREEPLNEPS